MILLPCHRDRQVAGGHENFPFVGLVYWVADWGHGELWLTPDHLVRIGRRGLTLRAAARGGAGGGAMVATGVLGLMAVAAADKVFDGRRPVPGAAVDVDEELWERGVSNPRRTLFLGLEQIVRLELRDGISTSRLNVEMADGGRHKLLWMANKQAAPMLAGAFGPRFGRS